MREPCEAYDGGSAAPGCHGEARFCLALVRRGETIEGVRGLIVLSEAQFSELKKTVGLVGAIQARRARAAVLREFEKLLRAKNGKENRKAR